MRSAVIVCGLIAALALGAAATPARAQTPDYDIVRREIEQLRRELEQVRKQYADRLAALEAKMMALAPAIQAQAAASSPPDSLAGAGSSKVFNPDIAVIGNLIGSAGTGAGNPEPGRAVELHESEVSFRAIIDPYARADVFLSFGEQGVSVEEGFVTFPTAPGGLLVRVGKMRAAFGKVNGLHAHVLPWADRPLVIRNLVGGDDGINDAGVSVARIIPNPWVFVEATAQVFRGDSADVFRSGRRGDLSYLGRIRAYEDLSESTNIELGGSVTIGHNGAGVVGDVDLGRYTTRLFGADATLRWKPLRRSIYRSFVARSEFVWSRREQDGGAQSAFGYYVSGDYQIARRWFAGVRVDRSARADAASLVDTGQALVLTFMPSEFSVIRGMYRRTRYALQPRTSSEFLMQVQFAIGVHGAHPF